MENNLECDIVHDDSIQSAKELGSLGHFLANCPEMIKTVDDNTAVLMRSLDAILLAIQMSGQQLDVHLQNTDENTIKVIENIKACRETSNQFIRVMKGTLMHQQKSTVDTLSKFLHFIADTFKDQGTNVFIFAENLMIDRFENETDLSKVISKDSCSLEDMLMENKELRETINELKDHIDVLDEKEQTFLKQEKVQSQKIRMMQSIATSLETDNNEMKTEIEDMKKQHHSETKELTELQAEHLKLIENIQQCRSEIKEKDEHIKTLETESKENNEQYLLTLQMKFNVETERDNLEKECIQLKNTIEKEKTKAMQLHNDLKAELNEKENTIRRNAQEMETLQEKLADKETSEKNYQTQLENEKKSNTDLKSSINVLTCQLNVADNANYALNKEMENKRQIYDENVEKKEKQVKVYEDEIRKNEDQAKIYEDEIQKNKDQAKIYEDEIRNIKDKMKLYEDEIRKNKDQAKVYEDELRKDKDQAKLYEEEISKNKDQAKLYEDEIRKHKDQANLYEDEIRTKKDQAKIYEEEIRNNKNQTVLYEDEIRKNKDQAKIYEDEIRKNKDQAKLYEDEIRKIKDQAKLYEDEIRKNKDEAMLNENEIRKNKDQAVLYEEEIRENKEQMADMHNQIRTIKRKNFQLKEEVENVSKVQVALEEELNILKSKRVIQVQLYSQNRTSLTSIVEQELTGFLKRKMESDKLELEFVQCVKASDIQSDLPVLLLCITVSRLGTDVANTVHGLALNQKTAALIFHHKDVHALPNQASERVLTGQQMKNLGGVFDMAFLSGKGIYDCEMNNNNVISLINFVNREGVKRVKYNA